MVSLLAGLFLAGCGERKPATPRVEPGLPAAVISSAAGQIDFLRAWVQLVLADWQRVGGPPGAGWTWSESSRGWSYDISGYSTVHVGGGAGSGEVRHDFTQHVSLRLIGAAGIVSEYAEADSLQLVLSERRRRYSLPVGFPLEDPHEYVTSGVFAVTGLGSPLDTLRGSGSQYGRDRLDAGEGWRDFRFDTRFELNVLRAVSEPFCAAESLHAVIAVYDGGAGGELLDRFSGGFSSAANGVLYSGRLISEFGPWSYAINAQRGCGGANQLSARRVSRD